MPDHDHHLRARQLRRGVHVHSGRPRHLHHVPGVQVYRLAFTQQSVGLASALAVTLMILVLLVVGPLQRLVNGKEQ